MMDEEASEVFRILVMGFWRIWTGGFVVVNQGMRYCGKW